MGSPSSTVKTIDEPGKLIERAGQLAALGDSLASVRGGSRGRLVLVSGEAGVGKTTLVRKFCADASGSARVLWGVCDALFTPCPLGPLVDVAEAVGSELAELIATGAMPHVVAAALLRELRGPAPTILVLEDVHWADEASLDVLRILARKVESVPVLVVCTYRDDGLDSRHPLRVVLGELGSGQARRVAVEPLSPAAVATLAEPFDVDAGELYRKTGGNSFFVAEVLASAESGIPRTVRDVVLARAARLSADARALLDAVAVVPPHAELWLLEAMAGETIGRIEECLGTGLLTSGPEGVAFRHELGRLAIEESLPPNRRVNLHRAAVRALAAPPSGNRDLARLAHHAAAAGDVSEVLEYAPAAAARAASLGAHREAAALYGTVLRFGGQLEPEARAELLSLHARESYLTDLVDDAIESAAAALELYGELGDGRNQGDALRAMSGYLWCPGRVAEAERASRQAVEVLAELPPGPELAMAYSNLAGFCKGSDEAIAWGRRGLALGRRLGDDEIVIAALMSIARGELLAGDSRGLDRFERILAFTERRQLASSVGEVYVYLSYGGVYRLRDFTRADRYIDAGLAYCEEHGLELFRLYLLSDRAWSELAQGRWTEAAESAALVLRVPRFSSCVRVLALVVLGLVRARRGDPEVWAPLEEALALAEPTGELEQIGPVAAAWAEAAWLGGRPEVIGDATSAAIELAMRWQAPWQLGELAAWRRRGGIAESVPVDVAEPYAAELAGDGVRAAELWGQIGCPYEAALALADTDDEDALRRALDELNRLDARPAAAIVSQRLRKRGARGLPRGPRSTTRRNPANLTTRELEVLALVAQGLGNPEIAGRLFLSIKTVDHHVSAILRKLGASTRREAPRLAARLGIALQDQ